MPVIAVTCDLYKDVLGYIAGAKSEMSAHDHAGGSWGGAEPSINHLLGDIIQLSVPAPEKEEGVSH